MFTGIVEHQGAVAALRPEAWGARLEVDPRGWAHVPRDGDSVSVNGCCLTVVGSPAPGEPLRFDVVPQTLGLTTVGGLAAGELVNLEVAAVTTAGGEWRTRVAAPPSFMEHVVERGSVAVDGVSLTVAAAGEGWFEVALIPATLAKTTLRARAEGSRVNLEADVLAKMVAERVRRALASAPRA
jgi:riboflavin synthase